MTKDKIYIFDTTLRDGAQTEGVDFSVEDKNKIAKVLSEIGIDYIEGGWPEPIRRYRIFFKTSKPETKHFYSFWNDQKLEEALIMTLQYLL